MKLVIFKKVKIYFHGKNSTPCIPFSYKEKGTFMREISSPLFVREGLGVSFEGLWDGCD